MIHLQQIEAYPLLALQQQYSALCNTIPNDQNSIASIDKEMTFAFPTLFLDVMAFIPVMD